MPFLVGICKTPHTHTEAESVEPEYLALYEKAKADPTYTVAQQAPADVKQKSDANRAAAKDTRWSEVVTLPSPDNPVESKPDPS